MKANEKVLKIHTSFMAGGSSLS